MSLSATPSSDAVECCTCGVYRHPHDVKYFQGKAYCRESIEEHQYDFTTKIVCDTLNKRCKGYTQCKNCEGIYWTLWEQSCGCSREPHPSVAKQLKLVTKKLKLTTEELPKPKVLMCTACNYYLRYKDHMKMHNGKLVCPELVMKNKDKCAQITMRSCKPIACSDCGVEACLGKDEICPCMSFN